jgi:hypothetical protein
MSENDKAEVKPGDAVIETREIAIVTRPPDTAKEMLHLIDQFLARADEQSKDLMRVLSALRGPDVDMHSFVVKHSSTVHIRWSALPLTAENQSRLAVMDMDPEYAYLQPKTYGPGGIHFATHIDRAVQALVQMGIWNPKTSECHRVPDPSLLLNEWSK